MAALLSRSPKLLHTRPYADCLLPHTLLTSTFRRSYGHTGCISHHRLCVLAPGPTWFHDITKGVLLLYIFIICQQATETATHGAATGFTVPQYSLMDIGTASRGAAIHLHDRRRTHLDFRLILVNSDRDPAFAAQYASLLRPRLHPSPTRSVTPSLGPLSGLLTHYAALPMDHIRPVIFCTR